MEKRCEEDKDNNVSHIDSQQSDGYIAGVRRAEDVQRADVESCSSASAKAERSRL
jgi:hypothetical protein